VPALALGRGTQTQQQEQSDSRNSAQHDSQHGILPFRLSWKLTGLERPTGGFEELPSSEAVEEEAGHNGKDFTLAQEFFQSPKSRSCEEK
jgi:hypothetical protein